MTGGGLTPSAFAGGHVLLTQGPGAGQIREILDNDATTLMIAGGNAFSVAPAAGATEYVAVGAGNPIIAVAVDFVFWREESMTGHAFAQFQTAQNILDARRAVRQVITTHNFNAVDNLDFNGVGTDDGGQGNFGYWSAGFSPVRQGGVDPRLPIDGSGAQPSDGLRGDGDLGGRRYPDRCWRAVYERSLGGAPQLRLRQPGRPGLGVHRQDRGRYRRRADPAHLEQ